MEREKSQGERGINTSVATLVFMPRKPLDFLTRITLHAGGVLVLRRGIAPLLAHAECGSSKRAKPFWSLSAESEIPLSYFSGKNRGVLRQQAEELAKQMTINKANEIIRRLTIERDEAYKAVKKAQLDAENKYTNQIDELSKKISEVHRVNKNMSNFIEDLYFKYTGEKLPVEEIHQKFKKEQKQQQKNKGMER